MDEMFHVWKRDDFLQMSPLTVGCLVMLASGGPIMEVVTADHQKQLYTCRWWTVDCPIAEHDFTRPCLTRIF